MTRSGGYGLRVSFLAQLGSSWTTLAIVVLSTAVAYAAVILLTRLSGVRSLATMSSFDFAATVAVGSTVATTAAGSTPLASGVLVLVMLFLLQYLVARLRRRTAAERLLDNRPLLVMHEGQVLDDNLALARVNRAELWAQLRMAGVHRRDEVRAVVMETTGSMSVITRDGPFDEALLEGVRGAEVLR